jgi:hypothetical protein
MARHTTALIHAFMHQRAGHMHTHLESTMLLSEFQLASIAKAASPTRLYADFSASMAHTSWHTMCFRDHDNWPGLQLLRLALQ